MKPIDRVGVRFKETLLVTDFSIDYATDTYNPDARNYGVIVSAPDRYTLINEVNHPLADPNHPSYREERNGDIVCDIILENDWVKVGMEAVCLHTDTGQMKTDNKFIDGIAYIHPSTILYTISKDRKANVCPGHALVTRLPIEMIENHFQFHDEDVIPSLGIVKATGSGISALAPEIGDIILHFGAKGQEHILPDGSLVELVFHDLIIAKLDKEVLNGMA